MPIFFQNDETLIFRQVLNIILPKNFFSNVIVNFELNLYNSNFCSIFPLESYLKKKKLVKVIFQKINIRKNVYVVMLIKFH